MVYINKNKKTTDTMAKRNIEVKEKELIDRLNNAVNPSKDSDNVIAAYHNIGDEWDEKHGIEFTDDVKDWATRDCSQDAKESRTGVANSILPDRRKLAEDICYKRIKRDEPKLAALKKALDEYKDTQPRTLNTEGYEYVNHPQHYNNYDMEVIEMMEKIFGRQATKSFCLLNAFKYRMRAGTKPNIPAEQDLAKEQWYLNKAKELS